MRGNIKSFEKPFTHAEVVALAERTLKRFGGDKNKAGRYARSMESRYESSKWAQVVEVLATSGRHHATKKSHAQLDREIAEALAQGSGKHKGDRYVVTGAPEYRQGWDDAGADTGVKWRKELLDALGDETLKVAIDALLEKDVERGLKLIHLTGSFEAALENRAFRYYGSSGLSSAQQLKIRRDPKHTEALVNNYKQHSGHQWQRGYVDRVLDVLEKKAGMREA